jgi:hypothetical protein
MRRLRHRDGEQTLGRHKQRRGPSQKARTEAQRETGGGRERDRDAERRDKGIGHIGNGEHVASIEFVVVAREDEPHEGGRDDEGEREARRAGEGGEPRGPCGHPARGHSGFEEAAFPVAHDRHREKEGGHGHEKVPTQENGARETNPDSRRLPPPRERGVGQVGQDGKSEQESRGAVRESTQHGNPQARQQQRDRSGRPQRPASGSVHGAGGDPAQHRHIRDVVHESHGQHVGESRRSEDRVQWRQGNGEKSVVAQPERLVDERDSGGGRFSESAERAPNEVVIARVVPPVDRAFSAHVEGAERDRKQHGADVAEQRFGSFPVARRAGHLLDDTSRSPKAKAETAWAP